ncbi:hypothetical protein D3C72_257920 [compost metagenome]
MLHVETEVLRVVACEQLREHVGGTVDGDFLTHQRRLAPDHLQRFVEIFPDERGAQDVVTFYHPAQRVGEGVQPFLAVEYEARLRDVRVTGRGREVVIEHAFLQRGQRIDVLHVGGAIRHRGDDAVEGFLIQLHQRQHVRGDAKGRAQPVAAVLGDQLQQLRLVRREAVPQRVIQRVVAAQNDQVFIFLLKADRMGGNGSHQFAEMHEVTCCKFEKK